MINNNKYPMISVIIPSYNRKDLFLKTLKAIQNTTYPKSNLKIIVVDDASSDGTDRILKDYKDITYIRHPKNLGRASTRNSGLVHIEGAYVFFLDDDQIINNDYFINHLKVYSENSDCVATVGQYLTPESFRNKWGKYLEKRGAVKFGEQTDLPAKYFQSGNISIRTDILNLAGEFDSTFDTYGGEDVDLGIRLKKYGKIYFAKNGFSYHYGIVELEKQLDRLEKFGREGFRAIIKKHPQLRNEYKIKYFSFPYSLFWSTVLYQICLKSYKYLPDFLSFKCLSYMQGYKVYKGYSNK